MYKIMMLALAGGMGTLARYGISSGIQKISGGSFPFGTLVVNMAGCLMFGAFWAFAEKRFHPGADITIIVLAGFLGAFTTFSSFMFDTGGLMREFGLARAAANIIIQNTTGIILLFAGLELGRRI